MLQWYVTILLVSLHIAWTPNWIAPNNSYYCVVCLSVCFCILHCIFQYDFDLSSICLPQFWKCVLLLKHHLNIPFLFNERTYNMHYIFHLIFETLHIIVLNWKWLIFFFFQFFFYIFLLVKSLEITQHQSKLWLWL